jgi:hypothetical protein
MKKLVTIVVLGSLLVAVWSSCAHANGAVNAALALSAFAAFTSLFAWPFWAAAQPAYAPVYVTAPPAYYAPPVYASAAPTYYAPPPPAIQREVVYPQGRYILFGDGVTQAYQWVWVPNPPPPGSAPAQ